MWQSMHLWGIRMAMQNYGISWHLDGHTSVSHGWAGRCALFSDVHAQNVEGFGWVVVDQRGFDLFRFSNQRSLMFDQYGERILHFSASPSARLQLFNVNANHIAGTERHAKEDVVVTQALRLLRRSARGQSKKMSNYLELHATGAQTQTPKHIYWCFSIVVLASIASVRSWSDVKISECKGGRAILLNSPATVVTPKATNLDLWERYYTITFLWLLLAAVLDGHLPVP